MMENGMHPVHPGEILREDFIRPFDLSTNALAKARHVPAGHINDIVLERQGIPPDTALRLARYFGGDARSKLNLQAEYDQKVATAERGENIVRKIDPRTA